MFLQNLRYSLRALFSNPLFTFVILLTMALGIGANTAIFSVMDSVLLKPLPYRDPARLVWIWSTRTDRAKAYFSIPDFQDFKKQNSTLAEMAGFANWSARFRGLDETQRLQGIRISVEAYRMLGVQPVRGRLFSPEDGRPDSAPVVMLGYGLWKTQFGGDESIVGRMLQLNDEKYQVIGVLPESYNFFGAEPDAQIAVPLIFATDPWRTERGSNFLRAYGRLKGGVTLQQAKDDLNRINSRLQKEFPDDNAKKTAPRVLPLQEELTDNYKSRVLILFGAMTALLLIACANIANLYLLRALGRAHEVAVRTAMGATRKHLLQQFLMEGLILTCACGAIGLLIAPWCIRLLQAVAPESSLSPSPIAVNLRALLFAFCVSSITGVAFGLAPYLQTFGIKIREALKVDSRSADGSMRSRRLSQALVVFEIALSLILMIGSFLLIRSFQRIQEVSPGFRPDGLLTARLSLPFERYNSGDRMSTTESEIARRIQELPGVRSAAAATILPLSGLNARTDFQIQGRPPRVASEMPAAQDRWVSSGYFHTMQIPLLQGREFSQRDTATSQPVLIVDQALANRYFPNENALGKKIQLLLDSSRTAAFAEIVGIVGNVKHDRMEDDFIPTLYAPLAQIPPGSVQLLASRMMFAVRTAVEPLSLEPDARRTIRDFDADIAVSSVRSMQNVMSGTLGARRFSVILLTFFAIVAFGAAGSGVYGVIAYSVARRTRETGIRMALGASQWMTQMHWVRQGLLLALFGAVIGWAGSLFCVKLLSENLFGVTGSDGIIHMSAALLLVLIAVLASYLPARRASKVDPSICLRTL